MKLKLTFIALFTTLGFTSFAQQTEKASLENSMAPATTALSVPDSAAVKTTEAKTDIKTVTQMPKKVSFSLGAGTMVSNYGMTSYLTPTMYYNVNSKFSMFTSVTYLNSSFNSYRSEGLQPMATKNYLMQVGGTYAVSDKLQISGSVWRDFSNISAQMGNTGNFRQPARYGTEFRATYKVNEFLTIHGAVRTSNGSNPYYNNFNSAYQPGSPFGF